MNQPSKYDRLLLFPVFLPRSLVRSEESLKSVLTPIVDRPSKAPLGVGFSNLILTHLLFLYEIYDSHLFIYDLYSDSFISNTSNAPATSSAYCLLRFPVPYSSSTLPRPCLRILALLSSLLPSALLSSGRIGPLLLAP